MFIPIHTWEREEQSPKYSENPTTVIILLHLWFLWPYLSHLLPHQISSLQMISVQFHSIKIIEFIFENLMIPLKWIPQLLCSICVHPLPKVTNDSNVLYKSWDLLILVIKDHIANNGVFFLPHCSHLSNFTIHFPGVVSITRTWSNQTQNFFPLLSPWYLLSSWMVSLRYFSAPDGWKKIAAWSWKCSKKDELVRPRHKDGFHLHLIYSHMTLWSWLRMPHSSWSHRVSISRRTSKILQPLDQDSQYPSCISRIQKHLLEKDLNQA